jgi:threonine-phosphate decarboxylase
LKHGANIYKYAKKLRCTDGEILDFSSNINLYQKDGVDITRYADASYGELKKVISKNYGIKTSQIKLFNGASAAIFELLKTLKQKRIYLYAPLYGEYEEASKGKKVIKINRFKDIYKKPKPSSIVVFVNPSTPDGKYYDLDKLFDIWIKRDITIIIDESFLEFEELKSCRDMIKKYKKLYIIQSFSKFYSCAGIRIGAVFSNEKNIKKLQTPLWNLSSFDVKFLTKRLKDKKFKKKSLKIHKKQKKELYEILKNSKKFTKIYKSDANFFLTKSPDAQKLFKHLLKHKILVRDCNSFDFLDDRYLRFGIKNKHLHTKLKENLLSL